MLESPPYLAIGGENLSPWSKRVTGKVERLMRFEGDQILPGGQLPQTHAGGLLLNAMNIAPELEAEFSDWYDKEHIPALGAVSAAGGRARDGELPRPARVGAGASAGRWGDAPGAGSAGGAREAQRLDPRPAHSGSPAPHRSKGSSLSSRFR
ncbi:MAG: hypothetical protein HY217_08615 [Candidatus Rokubacteria bacterium]|nr:hypothetical protein [Candidatus Rokubacteria bacterium]